MTAVAPPSASLPLASPNRECLQVDCVPGSKLEDELNIIGAASRHTSFSSVKPISTHNGESASAIGAERESDKAGVTIQVVEGTPVEETKVVKKEETGEF